MKNSTIPDLIFRKPCVGRLSSLSNDGRRWRVKCIRAGSRLIVKCYPVRADYTQVRHHRGRSRPAQNSLNLRNSMEQFRLLSLNNFSGSDLFVTLTFSDEPDERVFQLDQKVFLERMKYFFRKLRNLAQREIKYIGCREDVNENNEPIRTHVHLLISGASKEEIGKAWPYGEVKKIEKTGQNIDNIIAYCCKTFPYKEDNTQRYIRSKNLVPPDESDSKTLDLRNAEDWEELEAILSYPREYFEEFYPEYILSEEPKIWQSEFISGYYLNAELVDRHSPDWQVMAKARRLTGVYDPP